MAARITSGVIPSTALRVAALVRIVIRSRLTDVTPGLRRVPDLWGFVRHARLWGGIAQL